MAVPLQQTTLVGREREQEQLSALLGAAVAGSGRLVLISGEAGIGKTTLVRDLVARARGDALQHQLPLHHDRRAHGRPDAASVVNELQKLSESSHSVHDRSPPNGLIGPA